MFPLSLEWSRCPDGIEVHDYGPEITEEVTIYGVPHTLTSPRHGRWLRCRTSRRSPVLLEAIDLEDPIAFRYINTRSLEERLAFFERYGFLGEAPETDTGEQEIEESHSERFHQNLRRALTASFGASPAEKSIKLNNLLKSTSMKTSIEMAGDGKGRMIFHPSNLLHFMCLEVATAAINDVSMINCENCGNAFLTGRMAHRRADAKFCSDRCRVAAMRKRNAAKAK